MRIKDELKYAGYFWLPSAPERKLPGYLVIADGGDIELEVMGLFDGSIEGLNKALNGKDELSRIVGHIEKGLVTLNHCTYQSQNISFGGISKSSIYVSSAFIGIAYDHEDDVLLNSFQFSVEGIDEWIGLSGINVTHNYKERTASITYLPPKEISLNLDDGMKLLVTFSWTLPGSPHRKEAKITQKTYFKLVSEQERPVNDFISAAHKITNLLCFAIDKTVCMEPVTATFDAFSRALRDGNTAPIPILIYYASMPYSNVEPKIDSLRMLFGFGQIDEVAERVINNWFNAYSELDPALDLYFSAKAGEHKYLEGMFLAFAQGLETYHRRTSNDKLMDDLAFSGLTEEIIRQCPEQRREWLTGRLRHGNEISFRSRIKKIIEPFEDVLGNCKDRKRLISAIVNTRNYLTHYDTSLESVAAKGQDLWSLCLKMEALFQLHLLQLVGFTKDEVKSILDNSPELQRKLKEI